MARENIEARVRITGEDAGATEALRRVGVAADDTGEELEEMGAAGFMALQQMEQKLEATWNKLMGFWRDIGRGVRETTEDLDKLAKTSRQLDIDPNVLRGLGYALEREGGNAEVMTRSLEILAQRMDDVQNNSADAVRDFQQLGVEVQNADGSFKELDEILFQMADSFAAMDDASRKNALARGVLSRAGGEFVNMLSKGSDGMRELIEESERYYGKVSQEQLQSAEELADAMTNLNAAIQGLTEAGLADLIEAATPIVETLANMTTKAREFTETHRGFVTFIEVVGGVGLAMSTLVIGVGLAAIKIRLAIASIRTEMQSLGIQTDIVSAKMGRLGTVSQGVAAKGAGGGIGVIGSAGIALGAAETARQAHADYTGVESLLGRREAKARFMRERTPQAELEWMMAERQTLEQAGRLFPGMGLWERAIGTRAGRLEKIERIGERIEELQGTQTMRIVDRERGELDNAQQGAFP